MRLDGLTFLFLGAIKAPSKRTAGSAQAIDRLNAQVERMCQEKSSWHYLDINSQLETADGKPLKGIYKDDETHYEDHAYATHFRPAIAPVVQRLYAEAPRARS